eukprot:TRINITY_DN7521_c0_g1_i2.p1 TRINITY_DN7521_c0_g1~~TRINITY_DN7521_c0_g1_i2.p1  ORF type:complete len:237 (+),score=48.89 TRINITY_DN7521_c0_g1_i2:53-763(+)
MYDPQGQSAPYFFANTGAAAASNPSVHSDFVATSFSDYQYGGKISNGGASSYGAAAYTTAASYGEDLPLLQELGIDLDAVQQKILFFLNPLNVLKIQSSRVELDDLSGPFTIICILGASLMLQGKVHFGHLYGISVIGCLSIWALLKLLTEKQIQLYESVSVLGYGLTPLTILSFLRLFVTFTGFAGFLLSVPFIAWSTHATATFFVKSLDMRDQHLIVGYPIGLFFTCFTIIIIF